MSSGGRALLKKISQSGHDIRNGGDDVGNLLGHHVVQPTDDSISYNKGTLGAG